MTYENEHPTLYQINARAWLAHRSSTLGRPATLDDIADEELDRLADLGFQIIYLLGVWQTGEYARREALLEASLYNEFRLALPDVSHDDICGSCFAISAYRLNRRLGEAHHLVRFRQRLHQRGLRLMLDFVPNHTAVDHPWAAEHPEYYIPGAPADLEREPHNFISLETAHGRQVLAHGRDPYFPAWRDTLQLNYGNPAVHTAMIETLLDIAAQCDGLRCDMAMLLLPGIIERVWNIPAAPFWPEAIARVRRDHPDFIFLAEVYWGLEWTLQQQGFDYTYDKGLYDRLRNMQLQQVHEHLRAEIHYQRKAVRFLENHDERRAAAVFPEKIHRCAAVLTYLNPGLRFFHQGQLTGSLERLPVQLCRAPEPQIDPQIETFYSRLLSCLKLPLLHSGSWQLLEVIPAAPDDASWSELIAWAWTGAGKEILLAAANYSPNPRMGVLRLGAPGGSASFWQVSDWFTGAEWRITSSELGNPGIPVELPAWGFQVLHFKQEAATE